MYERFRFRNKEELIYKSKQLGLDLPFSDDIKTLFEPLLLDGRQLQNRFVVQPMEGYDSETDGSPSDLSQRRYLRYAEGGSGVIWFEAVSVAWEGRSNPRQMWLTRDNLDKFKFLTGSIRKHAAANGNNPLLVIQLTHSGRYSKPEGHKAPLVAANNFLLDRISPVVLTDDDLRRIQDQFVDSSKLAKLAGFDAIDLKACHGYLINEMLSCTKRLNSIFGGPLVSSRFRFLTEIIDRLKTDIPDILITSRLGIWDGYAGGFGTGSDGIKADYSEPELLVRELISRNIKFLNLTMGSPYFNPHVVRPFDKPLPGATPPEEHPLEGVMRMINGTSYIQHRFPELFVVGSGYSYLRQFAPNVGEAVLNYGGASLIGFGRNSFAYPSMPRDLMEKGYADRERVCIGCSGCSRLIGNLRPGGCVIRDREIYGKELKKLIADGKQEANSQ
jgi:2,4-dienoyl-CoA reductase-like NADH-dependent reductase (Old Yellow Enzyme family)